ncbi:MAG: hypothetical protein GC149_01755 [Gammaproteobacteria bacterium]|nr:hypothetical protein [Gammaproteobacteria bacterium]
MDSQTRRQLIQVIESAPPRPHHHALLEAANNVMTHGEFRHVLSKGGWYRVGGVLSPDGNRLGLALEDWVGSELKKCGNDFEKFLAAYTDKELLVTRHAGRIHYFVAPYGPAPEEFLQLEVEELQELWDRKLINPEQPPQDRTTLVEPIDALKVDAHPVGSPRYRFARLLDARELLVRGEETPLGRFLTEWSQSRAAENDHFCEHWLLANLERYDPDAATRFDATLMSVHARTLTPFQWDSTKAGVALGNQLREFDRAAGYPAAWYFHLVANKFVPGNLALELQRDRKNGYAYLAGKDLQLLENLASAPYRLNQAGNI